MTASIRLDRVVKTYRRGVRHGTFKESILRWGKQPDETGGVTFNAVDDVSLEIQPGEILGLLGDNGSGKSTLLKLIAGITQPTSGTVQVNGTVASLLEVGVGFHPEMTGYENVKLSGALLGIDPAVLEARLPDIVAFSELAEFMDTPVKHYSSGMYLRLGFAIGAFVDPDVILVDEVLAVGDLLFQKKCHDHLRQLRRSGKTIVMVSHNMQDILSLCTRAVLLDKGRAVGEGLPLDMITLYRQQLFLKARQKGQRPPADVTIWNRDGDFEARIEYVEMRNAKGESTAVFTTGERATFEVHWVADRPLNFATVALAILDDDEREVFTTATHFSSLDYEWMEGKGVARFEFERLDLLEGYYSLWMGLGERPEGPGSSINFWHGRDMQRSVEPFMVRPTEETRARNGVANLPCRCSIEASSMVSRR